MFFFRKHDQDNVKQQGVLNAFKAFLYVAAVALFMTSMERLGGPREDIILAPIAFLMLFVLSVAVMAMLVFGAPAMLYVDGKKKEAVQLVAWTIGTLAAITICTLLVMAFAGF